MRGMTAVLTFLGTILLAFGLSLAQTNDGVAQSTHYGLSGIVAKIQAGVLIIKVPHSLQPRVISPNKADRVGLHNAKI